jgi:hypothetical protein
LLRRYLTEVEPDLRSTEPYRQAEAYAVASRLYHGLINHADDATWKQPRRCPRSGTRW